MTDAEKIEFLAHVTDETDASVLDYALRLAKEAVLRKAFPFLSELPSAVPARFESTQVQIAEYLILKQGAGGEKERTENGIRQVFESGGIPESMLAHIVPKCKTVRSEAAYEGA